jgi:hypothetical protein
MPFKEEKKEEDYVLHKIWPLIKVWRSFVGYNKGMNERFDEYNEWEKC